MSRNRLILLTLMATWTGASLPAQTPTYWPQFRGPDRTNVARDTGLLKEWPEGGPPLVWKVTNLGDGIAPVSVAEGRLYTVAYREGQELSPVAGFGRHDGRGNPTVVSSRCHIADRPRPSRVAPETSSSG